MNLCKTCRFWIVPNKRESYAHGICNPIDMDGKPMSQGFETRVCKHPDQTNFEPPIRSDGFALTDGSMYYAALATGEAFGCVLHESASVKIGIEQAEAGQLVDLGSFAKYVNTNSEEIEGFGNDSS